jgi:Putative Flp pilus-assembly TadE/G-like
MTTRDDGSTLPLIIGFFVITMLMTAGAVAAGDAFVQQRGLQDVCDGAAAAAAAGAADLDRTHDDHGQSLHFAGVQHVVDDYLARDPSRRDVRAEATLSADTRTVSVRCDETRHIVFGTVFGKGGGVHHIATAAAQAPVR